MFLEASQAEGGRLLDNRPAPSRPCLGRFDAASPRDLGRASVVDGR
jgi:hypothetical protein